MRYSGYSLEFDSLGGEFGSDLRPDLVMAEEAEQKTLRPQACAGDQGCADETSSLNPVILNPGRPAPGNLGSHEDVVEAADAGASDSGDFLFCPRFQPIGPRREIITRPQGRQAERLTLPVGRAISAEITSA